MLIALELTVGGVRSIVDELLTDCPVMLAASLPTRSCTALLAVVASTAGAVYDTVTVCPEPAGEARVSSTFVPLIATLLTARSTPATMTVKADAGAVVAFSDSL